MRAATLIDAALATAALAATALFVGSALAQSPGSFSTLTTTGTATLNGDVLMCSGKPWIDVRCNGAVGDDVHDDTAAIQTTINSGVANNWPVHIPAGSYKVTSLVTIDYASRASSGFRLISEGATIDGRAIAAGPVLQVQCGGGTPASPTNCFYLKEEGSLFVNATTPAYAVVIGKSDFSDAHNSIKIDHLLVNNSSASAAAGGCQSNYVLDSDIWAACVSAGGAAGLAVEQTQFSHFAGAGTAQGTGGRGVVIENGYSYSNTFAALDLEVSPTCLSVTTTHDGENTFLSPYFNCNTAINATGSVRNTLVNPLYGGGVVNFGPQSTGIRVIGTGNRASWQYPAAATYTVAPIDEGLTFSSFNAPGASLTATLPAPAALTHGWSVNFATDNNKGLTITTNGGLILAGGKTFSSFTLGTGNYEYVRLEFDGTNFRAENLTRNTQMANGVATSRDFPGNWLFPSSSGYAAALADNGNVLSSFNTTGGLTVTLPSTTGLSSGWSLAVTAENGRGATVQVNSVAGGSILYPKTAASGSSSVTLAGNNYEFVMLQYDGNGNFRVVQATPATAQALGLAGPGAVGRWSFPAVSAYTATLGDNGNVVSSFNSPLAYMTVTLPAVSTINAGWTIGIASDNGKAASVQVNGSALEKILIPGTLGAKTSLSLSTNTSGYELIVLQFDGSNFRVLGTTPLTGNANGMSLLIGTPSTSAAPCQTGALQSDGVYLYVCAAPNTWKRAALSSF